MATEDRRRYAIVDLSAILREMRDDERIASENPDQMECRYWANALRWVTTHCLREEL